jgi:DNA-binding CsgD family transcriptional regulator
MGRRGRPRHPDVLTPRQREVLQLVREGLTNPQIATRLGISPDGAKWHVKEIIERLGVATRREAARWDEGKQPAAPSASPRAQLTPGAVPHPRRERSRHRHARAGAARRHLHAHAPRTARAWRRGRILLGQIRAA